MRAVSILMLLGVMFAAAGSPPNLLPPELPPEIYAWFWLEKDEFSGEGYRTFIDLVAAESNFGLLTTSLRAPAHEITDPATHDRIKRAVAYARERGLRVAFDLDVRLARGAFRRAHPGQQQWMLRVRAFPAGGVVEIAPARLADHMTGPDGAYEALSGRLMGVFESGPDLRAVATGVRVVEQSARRVAVEVPARAIVAAAFEHRTPDVFAPALPDFQRRIYEQYRDVPLAGVLKDEWGFPPVFNQGPREGDFWYSRALAEAYTRAGGGDFVRDAILMALGAGGPHEARMAAVNRYTRLILTRNVEIEQGFYREVKRIFGPAAFTGTHATWGHMPFGDAFKNGYDWWQATRDYGQTDEHWPLPVRTALAKKMGKPVWYNQFYDRDVAPYAREVWRNARAGGRVNVHPLWPSPLDREAHLRLLHSPMARALSRVRLLDFITAAPIDCPVAVVFGHTAALNWLGPHFGDLGLDFAEELWAAGVRADVLPSTEIASGALQLDNDGWVRYGAQRYRALVFLNPAHEPASTFDFLGRVGRSRTLVSVRGSGGAELPGAGRDPTPGRVVQVLWNWHNRPPGPLDPTRLTDGTCLIARGENDPAGDPIDEEFSCGAAKVKVRATGVFAIRLDRSGEPVSLAASDLRVVEAGAFRLELPSPTDLALWRDPTGRWKGVMQGGAAVPQALLRLTRDWTRLAVTRL